jgi:GT2 family glycosyltransferase
VTEAGLTIVVPTYQRRERVMRLVESLAPELTSLPGCEVVVVVDGSTDGTAEALAALDFPVPLRVVTQPNRGQATARNAGVAVATNPIVLFIDDDHIAEPGLVSEHLAAHRSAPAPIAAVGSVPMPEDSDQEGWVLGAGNRHFEQLRGRTAIERADLVATGNLSVGVETFHRVGAFDEGFVGWGPEDYDFGVRLLDAGIPVLYLETAIAWHLQHKDPPSLCRDARQEGATSVHTATKGYTGPGAPEPHISRAAALLLRGGLRQSSSWDRLARASLVLYRVRLRPRRSTRNPFLRLAMTASRVAGCLDTPGGRELLTAGDTR